MQKSWWHPEHFAKKIPYLKERARIMTKEVPDTLQLYLGGRIEHFWSRTDKPDVVFVLEAESVEQAQATVDALPLVVGGYCRYELMPIGPLAPLGLLLQAA